MVVAVYPVIGVPFVAGALQVTTRRCVPRVTEGVSGVAGTPAGVTGNDGVEGSLVPSVLVPVTVKV